jgi:phage gpG-like protein
MASKFNFERIQRNVAQMKRELPRVLANDTQKFFAASWDKQGWDNNGVERWKDPQRKIAGTPAYKYPKKGADARHTRATMVQSGRLRRAVGSSIRSVSFDKIRFVVDVPYAAVHNYGLPMKNGKPMPQRKFIGDSKNLRILQLKKIKQVIDKIWQA